MLFKNREQFKKYMEEKGINKGDDFIYKNGKNGDLILKKIKRGNFVFNFVLTLNGVMLVAVFSKSNVILSKKKLIVQSLITDRKISLNYSDIYSTAEPLGRDRFKPAKFDERNLVHILKENGLKLKGEHFINEYVSLNALMTDGKMVPYLEKEYTIKFNSGVFNLNNILIDGKRGYIYDKFLFIYTDKSCYVDVQLPSIRSFKIGD